MVGRLIVFASTATGVALGLLAHSQGWYIGLF